MTFSKNSFIPIFSSERSRAVGKGQGGRKAIVKRAERPMTVHDQRLTSARAIPREAFAFLRGAVQGGRR